MQDFFKRLFSGWKWPLLMMGVVSLLGGGWVAGTHYWGPDTNIKADPIPKSLPDPFKGRISDDNFQPVPKHGLGSPNAPSPLKINPRPIVVPKTPPLNPPNDDILKPEPKKTPKLHESDNILDSPKETPKSPGKSGRDKGKGWREGNGLFNDVGKWIFPTSGDTNVWKKWDSKSIDNAKENKQRTLIHYTADWCGICRLQWKGVDKDKLEAAAKKYGFVIVEADFTDKNSDMAVELSKLESGGVPLYLFIDDDGKEYKVDQIPYWPLSAEKPLIKKMEELASN